MSGESVRVPANQRPRHIMTFTLRLELDPDGPMTGTITSAGGETEWTFRGWIDFLAVLDTVRRRSRAPEPVHPRCTPTA
jgi:hypothetical protein